ncbi:hypothetical protein F5Y14DRAFT_413905 [Nemania sp. NC0429]|nr:hypothetical protein F5Y14DRAFT_413905 [Nemania sp. NC0429]
MASSGGQDVGQRKGQSSKDDETPEEQQLQRDLDHLALLLVRARDVRTALARLLGGMPEIAQKNRDSLEVMFSEVVDHMKGIGTEIQDFEALYTSKESKKVLQKASTSREANPRGIKPWLYQDHADWADVPR